MTFSNLIADSLRPRFDVENCNERLEVLPVDTHMETSVASFLLLWQKNERHIGDGNYWRYR
jgi:hypothetical protein